MIKDTTIEKVNSLPIEEVIGRYVKLEKKGALWVGLCPFHADSTPSFKVSPAKGVYKCFACGQGGPSAIHFVMQHEKLSYPLAIKKICEDHGIECEEDTTYSVKEEELSKRKEAMIANFMSVQDFYRKSFLECPKAMEYAYGRWGEELCEEMGIGYAPGGNALLAFAKDRISEGLLFSMGMVSKRDSGDGYYDFFRDRLTIPIRDRMGQVVAYTARTMMSDEKLKASKLKGSKYLNNCNTAIYSKSINIFNLDKAIRNLDKKHPRFYAVEGAPDVISLYGIGVKSVVATLGAQWNEAQLRNLKRYCTEICFIPDSDPPKNGEDGPGISGVIKSAKAAINLGFSCYIREIPLTPDGNKNDADSYCKTLDLFEGLQEVDFIEWYAARVFKGKRTPTETAEAFHLVSDVIGTVMDEVLRKQYTDRMAVLHNNADLWEKKVRERADEARRERENTDQVAEVDTMALYNFGIDKRGFYYVNTDKGNKQISNFTMVPLWHIRDDSRTVRIFRLTNRFHFSTLVEFRQEELVSLSQFRLKIESIGNFVWSGKEDELLKVKQYLYSLTKSAQLVRRMGWQKKYGFYAFGNGIVYNGSFIKADDQGMVKLEDVGNFYFPAASDVWRDEEYVYVYERNFFHRDLSGFSLQEYTSQVVKVFGNNGMVGIAFLLAAIFRDVVVSHTDKFPILNIFGQKSSGKSELAVSLMAFFINNTKPDNLNSTTLAAAGRIVAQCSNALVHFDEYKNNLNPKFIDFFKGLWDRTGRTLSNKDDDRKSESTAVDTAVIITGQEMPTVDVALFTRLIFLSNSRTSFTAEEKSNMERLKYLRGTGCSHLTIQLLSYRKFVERGFKEAYDEIGRQLQEDMRDTSITDRIFFNWRVILAMDRVLHPHLSLPYTSEELYRICKEGMRYQETLVNSNDEVAGFWSAIQFMFNKGEILRDSEFRIDATMTLKCEGSSERTFPTSTKVLMLRYKTVLPLYQQYCRSINAIPLPEPSLVHYLTTGPGYLGKKKSVRFKVLNQYGMEVPVEMAPQEINNRTALKTTVDQAFCFEYNELSVVYGLSIEQEASTKLEYNTSEK